MTKSIRDGDKTVIALDGSTVRSRGAPMLLQKAEAMFQSAERTHEPKWGGLRVLAAKVSR